MLFILSPMDYIFGILNENEVQREGFRFYLGDMDYFIANELFALFFTMIFLGVRR